MKYISVVLILLLSLSACDKKEKEKESAININDGQFEQNEIKIEEKRQSGDTLAMPYETLKGYLPSTLSGYKEVEVTGKEINEHGMSWSHTKKKYVQGGQTMYITLADYNGAYGLYAGATMVLELPNVDNEDEHSESITVQLGSIKAWQSYKKQTKDAVLIMAINDRFLINIEAQNQINADHVRAIAETLDVNLLKDI
jgi:hypothetical protein